MTHVSKRPSSLQPFLILATLNTLVIPAAFGGQIEILKKIHESDAKPGAKSQKLHAIITLAPHGDTCEATCKPWGREAGREGEGG